MLPGLGVVVGEGVDFSDQGSGQNLHAVRDGFGPKASSESRHSSAKFRPICAHNDMKSNGQSPKHSMEAAKSGDGVHASLVPATARRA